MEKRGHFCKTLILCMIFVASTTSEEAQSEQITIPGDIIIGGIFPVHKEGNKENQCGPLNEIPGYQYMEAMLYALEIINNRTDILPGIKLGTIMYDTCRSPTISADKTKEFIKLTLSRENANITELAGVIGPFTSGNSIIVANFLRVFQIPQISYASLSVELSNKRLYNYFFRTVPPDSFFARALAALIVGLRWDFVSIISSTGTYSRTGTQEVMNALDEKNICIAARHLLPRFPTEDDYNAAIKHVLSVEEANVVIFVTIQRDSRGLLEAKKRQPLAKRLTLLGSIGWSNRDDITNGLGEVADGTITFGHQEGNIKEFENYFRLLNLSNYKANYKGWFEEFWQKQFSCNIGNSSNTYNTRCSGKESLLTEHMEIAPVRVVINAVNAMAYAIHNMHQYLCPNETKMCAKMIPIPRILLTNFLKNVTFHDSSFNWPIQFNSNNEVAGNYTVLNFRETKNDEYSYVPIGTWTSTWLPDGKITGYFNNLNFSEIYWSKENNTTPVSVCSKDCDKRSTRVPRVGFSRVCCWDCEPCGKYDLIVNNTCKTCKAGFVPQRNFSICTKLTLTFINMNTPGSIFLISCSGLGIVTDLVVFALFLANKDKDFIKASNQEMGYVILFGLFLIFVIPFAFLLKPIQILCHLRKFLVGISFAMCYCPLLVKIRTSYVLYQNEKQETPSNQQQLPSLVNPRSQCWLTLGFLTLDILLCLVTWINNHLTLEEVFFPETDELFLECSSETLFIAYFLFSVIFLIPACTWYAFLSRNISREALYIGFTVSTTNVMWVVFLAWFVNTANHGFSRLYLTSGFSVLIGWVTLVGLFAPNVWQLKNSGSVSTEL